MVSTLVKFHISTSFILLSLFTFTATYLTAQDLKQTFMGCYKEVVTPKRYEVNEPLKTSECVEFCSNKYYSYALVKSQDQCVCSNILGEFKNSTNCQLFCNDCSDKESIVDVYSTAVLVSGPPRNFDVANVTNTSAHLSWAEPESHRTIDNYKVVAHIMLTYSRLKLLNYVWKYPNDTFKVGLISLHPGTTYNFTVQAVSPVGDGAAAFKVVDTEIGEPDMIPKAPTIIKRESSTLLIQLEPVINNNGPVSSYLIIVIDADSVQAVLTETLKPYRQASSEGYSYYIAAEVQPQRINDPFIVGDGKVYGKYYNAPLQPDSNYHIMLGIVSRSRNAQRIVYSEASNTPNDVFMGHAPNEDSSSALIVILSLGIVVISLLLVAGLIGFYLLRNRVEYRHRQRLTTNQELIIQGPMIDVENNGYIPDEELAQSSNHYQNLNNQVWVIPKNLLIIEHTMFLGIGKFGRVHGGSVIKNEQTLAVSIYSIADKKLSPSDKRSMLLDLDVLIKAKGNGNVLDLIGTCESDDTICVVLERCNLKESNLKDYLLSARTEMGPKFSTMSEHRVLDVAVQICRGMEFLHGKRLIHKQLCSLYVAMVGSSPKIAGLGLSKINRTERTPNLLRYTAKEIFRGFAHSIKSDVWAFGCVLWEICALGGSLHAAVPNDEISDRIIRGLLLPQLQYVYDPMYQVMLNCWQMDPDERPTFKELKTNLELLASEEFLNFQTYPGFQHERYVPDLEFAKTPTY